MPIVVLDANVLYPAPLRDYFITNNLKDFPINVLVKYSMQAIVPDDFVSQIIAKHPTEALAAFENQVRLLRNPPLTKQDVLRNLENCGLHKSVTLLKNKI